ncbi:MAG: hypothetical protein GX817_06830 [Elusimicrobia bacterium]|nr:hypothetical protein [Elusimicrobiota bacterium]
MNILGISCYYHDSAAALIMDGKVVAAAQEERFNRKKSSAEFPLLATNYVLQEGGISILEIDAIIFYENPFQKFARVMLNHLKAYPFSLPNFMRTTPVWLDNRLIMPLVFKKELGYTGKVYYTRHHNSHAASAFFLSSFEESAFMTADGIGEFSSVSAGMGTDKNLEPLFQINYTDSLGLFYTAISTFLGFRALTGEGKVMGLASYGNPRFTEDLREIIEIRDDGSFRIDTSYFGFNKGHRMFNRKFIRKFGTPRVPESEITPRDMDLAASLQKITEEILINTANHLYGLTKSPHLSLAGGVFLNCVANGKIVKETPFQKIFVQPAAGDSGGALGAAAAGYTFLSGKRTLPLQNVYLGPSYTNRKIEQVLSINNLEYKKYTDQELVDHAAKLLSKGMIAGWFHGRMEFGPRALGHRSILASPADPKMKDRINKKVKRREIFRPYAPSVLKEHSEDYFDLGTESPFMLFAGEVRKDMRDKIPAVTHVDNSARIHTVEKDISPRYYALIEAFHKTTGIPVLLNTSFNVRGQPIVNTPQEAIDCFLNTDMDFLVLENFIIEKHK